jgi:transposase
MSNGSTEQMKMTAGIDLGDYYSHLCLIDTQSGELIDESRLRTTPEAMRRRFDSEQQPLHLAIEVGTHSPWVSRLLTECGHEVLIANPRKTRLIYGQRPKTDKLDALRSWPASLGPIPNFCTRLSTEAATPRLTWR